MNLERSPSASRTSLCHRVATFSALGGRGPRWSLLTRLELLLHVLLTLILAPAVRAGDPSLTIYNQNFAVVRDSVQVDLKSGINHVTFAGATAYVEPSSVILRDPSAKHTFRVLEQNYRGDPVTQEMLLALNEGKTIDFELIGSENGQTKRDVVPGKIIRSGYYDPRGQAYMGYSPAPFQPVIEVNGKLRFSLPGQPLFPALTDDNILKPTLLWVIEASESARFDAEVSYVTGEMQWEADYNLVLPERGNALDLAGWITMDNESGRTFEHARIKLMAGDVNKIQSVARRERPLGGGGFGGGAHPPPVTEKTFDEYHLYTLDRPATLRDREKKQVEFVRAAGVQSTVLYVYDGAAADPGQDWTPRDVLTQPEYGIKSSKDVWVFREFTNSAANHLGSPLPKGRIRIYRRNTDGQMEFTGENTLKHTPRDELIRLYSGNAFDLVGERKRTEFKIHLSAADPTTGLPVSGSEPPTMDESFSIALRNHKTEVAEVRLLEHLYRWVNWEITKKSDSYVKTDAQTIEFRLRLRPGEEKTITYTVHYSW